MGSGSAIGVSAVFGPTAPGSEPSIGLEPIDLYLTVAIPVTCRKA